MRVQRSFRGLHDARVTAQPQVVVCTEIQHPLAGGQLDFRALGRGNDSFPLEKSRGFDLRQLCFQMVLKVSVHPFSFVRI